VADVAHRHLLDPRDRQSALLHCGLRLITCGGLDPDTDSYEENVVVFAALVT